MRTEAGALFRACTLTEACLQDATLAAASNSPSWWQIKTSSIYRNADFPPRRSVSVHSERIRRLQVGTAGLTTESRHLMDDSAIYCETVVHDTSST